MAKRKSPVRKRGIDYIDVSVDDLAEFDGNPRKISREEMENLKYSIERFGYVELVVIDEKNKLIGGHQRVKAMRELGVRKPIKAVRLKGYTEDEKKALNIALNRISGEWDNARLETWLRELDRNGFDLDKIGFGEIDLKDFGIELDKAEKDEDDAPAVEQRPVIAEGDLICLGPHRLICGDSSDVRVIGRLMDGEKIDMAFTDPPYGVAIGDKNKFLNKRNKAKAVERNLKNDDIAADKLKAILIGAFRNLKAASKDKCAYYVTAPQGGELGKMMLDMMDEAGLPVKHILIWAKNAPTFSMGRLDYDYKHEPILYTWNKKHDFNGAGSQKFSVWNIDKPVKSKEHPTMKPVELIENAVMNSSKKGAIVGDIFLGSGSTLIACEKTGRVCYGVELDPLYCGVIIERYLKYADKKEAVVNGRKVVWEKYKQSTGERKGRKRTRAH